MDATARDAMEVEEEPHKKGPPYKTAGGEVGSMKKWTQSEKVEWLVSIVLSIVASVATTMLAKWLGVW